MKIDTQKDHLYKNNRYASNKVVLDKKFLFKRRLEKGIVGLVFLVSLSLVLLIGYRALFPIVAVDGKEIHIDRVKVNELEQGSQIVYRPSEWNYEDYARFYLGLSEGVLGEVDTLPLGVNEKTGYQLGKDKIIVKCLSSGCMNEKYEIYDKTILGKVQ